jgi:hypothetical protein
VQDLHPTSDIRFVIREVGELSANVERLITDISGQTAKLGALERSVDRFKTAAIVMGIMLGVFVPVIAGIFWWAVGERITTLLLHSPPATQSAQTPKSP